MDQNDNRHTEQPIALHEIAERMAPILARQSDVFAGWTFEYPGFIAMETDGGSLWAIGTANGVWGADFYIVHDAFVGGIAPDFSVATDVPGDCTDPDRIALALFAAMVAIDGESTGCPECERSFGPHYTGPCEH